ncbi:MAG: 7-cyano-7-deazaguanine synthase QueC [Verrucomicrobia bacterium]|nr:MAG: 7-cyano-7-deazaguanine synthase QueC [Verrucomicrobiota bacterium]
MSDRNKKAVVLLSGGLDSATAMAMAADEGFEVYAMSFNYGQRHSAELDCASEQANKTAKEHKVVEIDLRAFGGSALTDDIEVPKHNSTDDLSDEIPVTYVPARNTIFLSYALAWAEVLGADDVFIGVNALDYSGYPDCRPEFIEAFEAMANLATVVGVQGRKLTIHTPLIALTKAEIIKRGLELGVDYAKTTSCYDPAPDGRSCGHCDSCLLRRKGFSDIGETDPRKYVGERNE